MSKVVYLVCGVSGAGKSWVCNQLTDLIHYVSSDKDGKLEPTRTLELHDRCTGVSTTIKHWTTDGIEVIPVFVMGDFLRVKQQLIGRGGKITVGLYRRWKRMKALSEKYGKFTGDSEQVLKWLKEQLKHRDTEHTIYLATSPSGKVYVGKTKRPLEERVHGHGSYAKLFNTAFARAIRKYGDAITWQVLEKVKGLEAANKAEIKWIAHYDSTNPNKGYNLTHGGDGGKRSPEAEERRVEAVKRALRTPATRQKLSVSTAKAWTKNRTQQTDSIRKVRSTAESRAKTRKQMERQIEDKEWLKKISEAAQRNNTPEWRDLISKKGIEARAKTFAAYKNGVLVGTWTNQKFAAQELGVPACSISRMLGGYLPHVHGYVFKYLDTETDHKTS